MAQEAPRNFLTPKAGTVDGDEKLEAELRSALTTTLSIFDIYVLQLTQFG